MNPYLDDGDLKLYVGDCRDALKALPAESVHCVVTSPPYWGLRDYGTGVWEGGDPECEHRKKNPAEVDQRTSTLGHGGAGLALGNAAYNQGKAFKSVCGRCGAHRVDAQLGLEPTPGGYVQNLVEIFREVRRVLRRDGTVWLNLGDTYAGGGGYSPDSPSNLAGSKQSTNAGSIAGQTPPPGLKPKDMVGIPWRVAFALQDDGWYLRSDIIWAKPNPMPESVTDRPTKSHEYVFLLSRSQRYFYDQVAVMEPAEWARWGNQTNHKHEGSESAASWIKPKTKQQLAERGRKNNDARKDGGGGGFYDASYEKGLRNARSVWSITTQSYEEAHFATFPEELPRRCIKAGTSERGCCPECGAPWMREAGRDTSPREVDPSEVDRYGTGEAGVHRKVGGQYQKWLDENPIQTVGWRPSCEHESVPVPCVVMDPFAGAGTTALVARKLGRWSVLVELSSEYAKLIAERTHQLSLLS